MAVEGDVAAGAPGREHVKTAARDLTTTGEHGQLPGIDLGHRAHEPDRLRGPSGEGGPDLGIGEEVGRVECDDTGVDRTPGPGRGEDPHRAGGIHQPDAVRGGGAGETGDELYRVDRRCRRHRGPGRRCGLGKDNPVLSGDRPQRLHDGRGIGCRGEAEVTGQPKRQLGLVYRVGDGVSEHGGLGWRLDLEVTDDMDLERLQPPQLRSELGVGMEQRPTQCCCQLGGGRHLVDVVLGDHYDVVGTHEYLAGEGEGIAGHRPRGHRSRAPGLVDAGPIPGNRRDVVVTAVVETAVVGTAVVGTGAVSIGVSPTMAAARADGQREQAKSDRFHQEGSRLSRRVIAPGFQARRCRFQTTPAARRAVPTSQVARPTYKERSRHESRPTQAVHRLRSMDNTARLVMP